jgi:tRNA 2-thiouridine synthesizing protein B
MASTWRAGDSIILLGSTVAFIDWFNAYLGDLESIEIEDIAAIYALAEDVAQLSVDTTAKLNLTTKLTAILSDSDWVTMTQNTHANGAKFDKVVTIAL